MRDRSVYRTMNSLIVGKEIGENKHEVNTGVKDLIGPITADGYNNHITVQTKTIDTFFEENNIQEVDFMKFDVEGAEDMILRSEFKKIVPKIKTIMVEFHLPTWQLLLEYMVSLGYQARRYNCSAIVILFFR